MLKYLLGISVRNCLSEDIFNVRLRYAEGVTDLKDRKTVNVETREDIFWTKDVALASKIQSDHETYSPERIPFGNNRGFWQLYFTCQDDEYKIDKNDATLSLTNSDDKKCLEVTVESNDALTCTNNCLSLFRSNQKLNDTHSIRISFKVFSKYTFFAAVKRNPMVREVQVHNRLKGTIHDLGVQFTKPTDISNIKIEPSTWIPLESNTVPVEGSCKTRQNIRFEFDRNCYWNVRFTYKGSCYKLASPANYNWNACDNGEIFPIDIKEDGRGEVTVEFRIRTPTQKFKTIEYSSTAVRDVQFRLLECFLESSNIVRRTSLNRKELIRLMRATAAELRKVRAITAATGTSSAASETWKLANDCIFSRNPKPCSRQADLRISQILSNWVDTDFEEALQQMNELFEIERRESEERRKHFLETGELYNCRFHRTDLSYLDSYGFGLSMNLLQIIGLNEYCLEMAIGEFLTANVDIDKFAEWLQDELDIMNGGPDSNKRVALCQSALNFNADILALVRVQLAANLRMVAFELLNENFEKNFRCATDLYTPSGIRVPEVHCCSAYMTPDKSHEPSAKNTRNLEYYTCYTPLSKDFLDKTEALIRSDKCIVTTIKDLFRLINNDSSIEYPSDDVDLIDPEGQLFTNIRSNFSGLVRKFRASKPEEKAELGYAIGSYVEILEIQLNATLTSINRRCGNFISFKRSGMENENSCQQVIPRRACTCAICLDIFVDPRVLPCGHTFCCSCLKSVIPNEFWSMCSMCKQEFHGNTDLLPKNYAIQTILDDPECLLPTAEPKSSAEVHCDANTLSKVHCDSSTPCQFEGFTCKLHEIIEIQKTGTLHTDSTISRITGVALCGNDICVTCEDYSSILRFDSYNFLRKTDKVLKSIRKPIDIGTVRHSQRFENTPDSNGNTKPEDLSEKLLILDIIDSTTSCIWLVDLETNFCGKWLPEIQGSRTISLNSRSVLVLVKGDVHSHLNVYDKRFVRASLIKSIRLSSEIKCPTHAVEEENGHLYISYGTGHKTANGEWSEWTISHVSNEGLILRSLESVTFSRPICYLAPRSEGGVWASVTGSNSLLATNSQLSSVQVFTSPDASQYWKLYEERNDIFIVGNVVGYVNIYLPSNNSKQFTVRGLNRLMQTVDKSMSEKQ